MIVTSMKVCPIFVIHKLPWPHLCKFFELHFRSSKGVLTFLFPHVRSDLRHDNDSHACEIIRAGDENSLQYWSTRVRRHLRKNCAKKKIRRQLRNPGSPPKRLPGPSQFPLPRNTPACSPRPLVLLVKLPHLLSHGGIGHLLSLHIGEYV